MADENMKLADIILNGNGSMENRIYGKETNGKICEACGIGKSKALEKE